eukprot:CCRYP_012945-RA/>CCRYP_012945-RA protein AED:0.42 eAED:0.43 QI:0/1/0.5/1/1/1/2/303/135
MIKTIDYSTTLPTVQATPLPPPPTVPSSPVNVNSNVDYFLLLGRQPTMMHQCPRCSTKNIRTHVRTYPSIISWLMAIGMFLLCWPLRFVPMWLIPIAFLPLLNDKLKRSDHYCSNCSQRVGTVAPLSDCGAKTLV